MLLPQLEIRLIKWIQQTERNIFSRHGYLLVYIIFNTSFFPTQVQRHIFSVILLLQLQQGDDMPSVSKMKLLGEHHYPQKTWSPGCSYLHKLFHEVSFRKGNHLPCVSYSVSYIFISEVFSIEASGLHNVNAIWGKTGPPWQSSQWFTTWWMKIWANSYTVTVTVSGDEL